MYTYDQWEHEYVTENYITKHKVLLAHTPVTHTSVHLTRALLYLLSNNPPHYLHFKLTALPTFERQTQTQFFHSLSQLYTFKALSLYLYSPA
jgi:hypothetical protein